MHLHQCIPFRYDDGSTDQLKYDWKSEDGVWHYIQKMVCWRLHVEDDADTNFLLYKLPQGKPRCITHVFNHFSV
jgi:hypothetical protein